MTMMNQEQKKRMHALTSSAFYESILKSSNFVYIEVAPCMFHILFEGNLYIFQTTIGDIEKPKIRHIKKQHDVDWQLNVREDHADYVAIKEIYMEGLLHNLFVAHHNDNLKHYGMEIENYFLKKLSSGYQCRDTIAVIKCTQKRRTGAENPKFNVSIGDRNWNFVATHMGDASNMAQDILKRNEVAYSELIHLKD